MKILLVEDDPFHAQVIGNELKKAFGPNTTIHVCSTEKQFNQEFREDKCDLVVLDQMLAWTTEDDPDPYSGAPQEGPLRAGTRCYFRLKQEPSTAEVPVVFLTNLDADSVPEEIRANHIRKSTKLAPLIEKIRQLLKK